MKDIIFIRSSLALVSVLVLSGLVAAGCGGGQAPEESAATSSEPAPTEAASSAVDVCTFLTPAEIQEVMGQAPGDPQHVEEELGGCTWPAADSSTLVRIVLSGSGYDSYEDFVAGYQSEFGGEEPPQEYYRPIQGVGNWAMYLSDRGVVQVFQGGRMLEVGTNPPDEARAVELARKAVARMG